MIRRPPRSTLSSSSAASDVYKRQSARFSSWEPSTSSPTRKSHPSSEFRPRRPKCGSTGREKSSWSSLPARDLLLCEPAPGEIWPGTRLKGHFELCGNPAGPRTAWHKQCSVSLVFCRSILRLLMAFGLLAPPQTGAEMLAEIPLVSRDGFLWLKVHVATSSCLKMSVARELKVKLGQDVSTQGMRLSDHYHRNLRAGQLGNGRLYRTVRWADPTR